ncbi:NAD(P)-dependent dehydrogenase (short-subunit alcohol dehydrogenase family) [Povalibacter uvarum]|uniref:NAD(P)-dependent dehydrogenase (Short-subunit alcohol dehydrogenase family) n=1 Tax=Povalibacter uvarum TaxID=732238 RepID=A0A841HN04_9GAMM|nr:SDR family oxidoreductase [Povalibacter uvarum]MBB6093984.1 NAD(P)-dependent dehydrogenase (short-subunit alcohol dehydrogenase family) [Povalibacter uvarum]
MNESNQVVIITGGGAGIGLAAARAFAHEGANVLITGRRVAKLDEITRSEPRIRSVTADVATPLDARRTIDKAIDMWGRIDVLVNNAGAGAPLSLADATADRVNAVYAVNVVGPTLLSAAAVPHLVKSRGSIINLSSSLATKAVAGFADYCASKAALEQLTRCWALELAAQGVRVNAVAAGPVETEFLQERMGLTEPEAEAVRAQERSVIPLGRRGVPEDVARWIVALASREAQWVTGQVFGIDGGFTLV